MNAERFWAQVARGAPDECWLWQGSLDRDGYANNRAHRIAYELTFGPIPPGLVIDHLCRARSCANPHHLEAVTNRENVLRGVGITAREAAQTHCKHGHEFTDENTWLDKHGWRYCRPCMRQRHRELRGRRRLAKGVTA